MLIKAKVKPGNTWSRSRVPEGTIVEVSPEDLRMNPHALISLEEEGKAERAKLAEMQAEIDAKKEAFTTAKHAVKESMKAQAQAKKLAGEKAKALQEKLTEVDAARVAADTARANKKGK